MIWGVVGQARSPVREPLLEPGRYRHFKGGEYELLSVGRHTETGELLVVYRSVDDPSSIWVRPLEMFVEPVDRAGRPLQRFQPLASRGSGSRYKAARLLERFQRAAAALAATARRLKLSGRAAVRS